MRKFPFLIGSIFLLLASTAHAQIQGVNYEIEQQLQASTKQLNQFFKRFNGEEDTKGKEFEPGDRQYRNERLRKKYMSILFDDESGSIPSTVRRDFIEKVTEKSSPTYINLRSTGWFATVNTTFAYEGREWPLVLYMQIQQEGLGYEWVIQKIAFEPYGKLFDKQRGETKEFLHPMSHELDFMNLRKALVKDGSPESYTLADFKPDLLTVFLYEVKKGLLEFKTVNRMNYHFFSVDGWYFSLTNFNRPGYNSGWLISDLTAINSDQKEDLLKIIYDEK